MLWNLEKKSCELNDLAATKEIHNAHILLDKYKVYASLVIKSSRSMGRVIIEDTSNNKQQIVS